MQQRPAPLPDSSILFHAGFHKSGTTFIQSALASSRTELLASGVLYPGRRRSHHRAAMVATARTWGWQERGGRPTNPRYWTDLVRDTEAHPGRVVISSEGFALADETVRARILAELAGPGGPHAELHVVFTLRPMARLLSSSWQQYLKYGLSLGYEQWLRAVFANPPECPPTPNFWRRNDHAGIIASWVGLVGPGRVHVIIPDEADRTFLTQTFEALLDLPDGSLVPDPAISAANRAMTAAEAELLRLVNAGGVNRWDWPEYERLVRRGAIMQMVEGRSPSPAEESIATPQWAVDEARRYAAITIDRLAPLGLSIHGDLARLSDGIPAGALGSDALLIPVRAASEALLGALKGAQPIMEAARSPRSPSDPVSDDPIRALTTSDAARLLRSRIGQAGKRRMARAGVALRRRFPARAR